jgi:hypothetical protein
VTRMEAIASRGGDKAIQQQKGKKRSRNDVKREEENDDDDDGSDGGGGAAAAAVSMSPRPLPRTAAAERTTRAGLRGLPAAVVPSAVVPPL